MKKFSENILLKEFLANQHVAVIGVDNRDRLHSAALRYYNTNEPPRFYFVTDINSEKCKRLRNGEPSMSASCVIGLSLTAEYTVQMFGDLSVDDNPDEQVVKKYYKKRGNKKDDLDKEHIVLLKFAPISGKYTDYRQGDLRHVYELEFDA